ncbi:MAG: alpha-glucan phosphorylase [Candidatus Jacksonbacteria bacterium RIFOXYC2_FULL_44_29]|nr:MAG: Glycogen phosphorylase [Parcubacteria group bacterium GW2011_GWC2_44_22]OGY77846.1 MAG: alpha-glucan phosphorylase [Candidatus Jacksonbacteria bacterium RIFOXYB2_FULL_44_15]OGY78379.1 MAG: alpha-glucan phosphorylase [Candidatus Jacksonbacteria bacterium RIFOXYD2_FULL_43_21]OGY81085.1 MAG: alpha-glucan phosphorylase [Candidatus Jacksonbacteria bacterium RIFOXYC2_FULL_44_29]HCC50588.1 alpha-glucan family phosphorylase [Candidatus Jacksonbacteria bacterium]
MADTVNNQINFVDMHVAYFCMEIGLAAEIPTYAGGLGVLSGDMLRSSADMELPMIGLTLLYKKGYFKQTLDGSGNQIEAEMVWNPADYLELLPTRVSVTVESRPVIIQVWLHRLMGVTGHINPVIFLDTDVPENSIWDRDITQILYGGDAKYRLAQEIVLGIGGVRVLQELGCGKIQKYHMNEGHSALLVLELFRYFAAQGHGNPSRAVHNHCVFTTHTPVASSMDQFEQSFAETMIGRQIPAQLRSEIFVDGVLNMTRLGLEFSAFLNGVAKKHSEISRQMFPGYRIESITNGIHSSFWAAEPFKKLFDHYLPGWAADPYSIRYVLSIPGQEIWEAHQEAKAALIAQVNKEYGQEMDLDTFTLGFARRATAYKRGDLLFSDPQRLKRIAKNCRGLQIIYAGKAHPQDFAGKELIKKIIENMHLVAPEIKVVYLADYDMKLASLLVAGVDLWLNTPVRPQEASGTSGMKAAINGVPHFSVLDGWWIEGHIENVTGWSIGPMPDKVSERAADIDVEDIEDMYSKLEYVILPHFYEQRDEWIKTMRHSIAVNGSFFNTHRMVQQYVLNAYFQ